ITRERAVAVFDGPNGTERLSYPLTSSRATGVVFSPSNDSLIIAANSFLYFADATQYQKPHRIKTDIRTLTALAISPDGQMLLAGGWPGTMEVYDVPTRTRKCT